LLHHCDCCERRDRQLKEPSHRHAGTTTPSCIYTVAGKFSGGNYNADGLQATEALLETPMGLSGLDAQGNYYIQGDAPAGLLYKVGGLARLLCHDVVQGMHVQACWSTSL
jgi:hypothetical protein